MPAEDDASGPAPAGQPPPVGAAGSAGADPDAALAALAALDASGLDGFEFVIEPDGSVTFVDFPPELLDIAYALNPDDPLVCERMALAGRR